MARIALPHPHRGARLDNTQLAFVLLVTAATLAAALSVLHLPSVATQGLPVDWAHRAAWLAVDALFGLALAHGLIALAERKNVGTEL